MPYGFLSLYYIFVNSLTVTIGYYVLLHTLTTVPILLPIHVHFSDASVSPRSMTRASITSLVSTDQGKSLLWIHIVLLFWITLSWMGALLWICHGAFYFRAKVIAQMALRVQLDEDEKKALGYNPHPHPNIPFREDPISLIDDPSNRGLRLRTVMVENVPPTLRSEKELKEYFEYHMSRPIDKPGLGLHSGMQPGFFNKTMSFLFNRAKRIPDHIPVIHGPGGVAIDAKDRVNVDDIPEIEKVTLARKMTELAHLLQRREVVLQSLETAHIKLAKKALTSVKEAMDKRHAAAQSSKPGNPRTLSQVSMNTLGDQSTADVEPGVPNQDGSLETTERMDLLIKTLGPYVDEFGLNEKNAIVRSGKAVVHGSKWALRQVHIQNALQTSRGTESTSNHGEEAVRVNEPTSEAHDHKTIWEALLSLPRSVLDPYQPLISLSKLFRGKTVPYV